MKWPNYAKDTEIRQTFQKSFRLMSQPSQLPHFLDFIMLRFPQVVIILRSVKLVMMCNFLAIL